MQVWFWSAEKQAVAMGNWSLQPPSQQAGFREPPIRERVRGALKYDEGKQAEWRDVSGRPCSSTTSAGFRPETGIGRRDRPGSPVA